MNKYNPATQMYKNVNNNKMRYYLYLSFISCLDSEVYSKSVKA